MAGESHVPMFRGWVNNMGYNAGEEIRKLLRLLDRFGLAAQIIGG